MAGCPAARSPECRAARFFVINIPRRIQHRTAGITVEIGFDLDLQRLGTRSIGGQPYTDAALSYHLERGGTDIHIGQPDFHPVDGGFLIVQELCFKIIRAAARQPDALRRRHFGVFGFALQDPDGGGIKRRIVPLIALRVISEVPTAPAVDWK